MNNPEPETPQVTNQSSQQAQLEDKIKQPENETKTISSKEADNDVPLSEEANELLKSLGELPPPREAPSFSAEESMILYENLATYGGDDDGNVANE